MSTFQKIAVIVGAVALVTAATLPGRQTPRVIDAITNLSTGTLGTAIKG